jgi:leucyl-tRNA synthetase
VGGAEHAVLHLLYARFWHKFLFDLGVVPFDEPFAKLASPGLILGSDGNKMSKSKGNVVNPDSVCEEHGVDTFRVYEMSMSDFRDPAPWNTDAIIGSRRFLDKAAASFSEEAKAAADDMKAMKLLHKTVKKVGEDIAAFKFNTAITAVNILLNEGVPSDAEFRKEWREKVAVLLHPFAPHLAEELWQSLGNAESVYFSAWPEYDEFMLVDDEVTIAVQVNGKVRGTLTLLNGVSQEEASSAANENPEIRKWTEGKKLIREIFVPNKLLSIVVE